MVSIFRLLFRACACLGVLLLISGVFINGFWISMIVGLLCGFIGYRLSMLIEFGDIITGFTVEFVAQAGAMLIVLTGVDLLMGMVLIMNRESLMTAVLSLAMVHTVSSRVLGR